MLLHIVLQVFNQMETKSSMWDQGRYRSGCTQAETSLCVYVALSSLDSRFVLAHRWFHCEFIERRDTNEVFLNLSKSWNWSESSGERFYEKLAFFFFLILIGNIFHVTLITPLGEQKTKTLPVKLIPLRDLDLSDICICKLHHSSIPDEKH